MSVLAFTNSAGSFYRTASYPDITSAGTWFLRLKPNWAHNDSAVHHILNWSDGATPTEVPSFQKFSNNNVYVGFNTRAEGDVRIIVAATAAMFTSGVWTNHLLTWDDTANTQEYFADNVSKGSNSATFTRDSATEFTLGGCANWATSAALDAAMAEFGRWNRILTAAERAILQLTGTPLSVLRGLVDYRPLSFPSTGSQPDLIGGTSLSLTGTVNSTDAPPTWYRRRSWNGFSPDVEFVAPELVPGTASFVSSGPASIVLTSTDADDGTPPYTYQWERSDDGVDYDELHNDGSGVSGVTTLTLMDGSAEPGILYRYRLRFSDNESPAQEEYSNVVTASVYEGGVIGGSGGGSVFDGSVFA